MDEWKKKGKKWERKKEKEEKGKWERKEEWIKSVN